jgi:hypothetical protein
MSLKIASDGRDIKAVTGAGQTFTVGVNGITRIKSYYENGERFAVYQRCHLAWRVGAHTVVWYGYPPAIELEEKK